MISLKYVIMDHLQKSWQDHKDSKIQGVKGSSEML